MTDTIKVACAGDFGYPGTSGSALVALSRDDGAEQWRLIGIDRSHIDGTPITEWQRRDLLFTVVHADLLSYRDDDAGRLLQIIEDAGIPALLARIDAGHSVEWDGSNHRGRFTDDAEAALEQLTHIVDQSVSGLVEEIGGCWRAADWIGDEPVEPHQTGATLLAEAEAEGARIWGGEPELDSALTDLREQA